MPMSRRKVTRLRPSGLGVSSLLKSSTFSEQSDPDDGWMSGCLSFPSQQGFLGLHGDVKMAIFTYKAFRIHLGKPEKLADICVSTLRGAVECAGIPKTSSWTCAVMIMDVKTPFLARQ